MRTLLEILSTPHTFKDGDKAVRLTMGNKNGCECGILELLRDTDFLRVFGRTYKPDGFYTGTDKLRSLLTPEEAIELGFKVDFPIPHKALVWCWSKGLELYMAVRFYNAKLKTTYPVTGYTASYENYLEVTQTEIDASPMLKELLKQRDNLTD